MSDAKAAQQKNSWLLEGRVREKPSRTDTMLSNWEKRQAAKKAPKKTAEQKPSVPPGNLKNKKKDIDILVPKGPKWYPVDSTGRKRKAKKSQVKVRKSVQPGVVVILLRGKFAGRRAVVLKTLPSGTALIIGPSSWNGVPLRRVNPAFIIATSTKIDISSVKIPDNVNDSLFKRPKAVFSGKSEEQFFAVKPKPKKVPTPERTAAQKIIEDALVSVLEKHDASLKNYLRSRFSLSSGQYPHLLKF
eukprot:TRINITY_DN650_c0_g1_i1.p1 TRINITY_DN650_c0_g1~~TRINITY_DN650_c0_g1_i1.p1  ORF type:complete len:245 (-),score=56.43 TRINITY_DN650_c0_g1_i1:179-913(-)